MLSSVTLLFSFPPSPTTTFQRCPTLLHLSSDPRERLLFLPTSPTSRNQRTSSLLRTTLCTFVSFLPSVLLPRLELTCFRPSFATARQPDPFPLRSILHLRLGHRNRRRNLHQRRVRSALRAHLFLLPSSPLSLSRPRLLPSLLTDFPPYVLYSNIVYLAPSGVQKERMSAPQIFVLPYPQPTIPTSGSQRTFLRVPKQKGLKESACSPLFWNAFRLREAGSCIHTHSQNAGE